MTTLASVHERETPDVAEYDDDGFEKYWSIAQFARAEGITLKRAYAGFREKGWPYRGDLGPMKVSREDRIQIREMCRRVNEPAAETPEVPKPRRTPKSRPPVRRKRRTAEAA